MSKKGIVLLIFIIALIAFVAGGILMVHNVGKVTKQEVTIRTDKDHILRRFSNIGKFDKCYWKADVIGEEHFITVPGPTSYWMKGFIEIDSEKIKSYIEKYNMREVDENIQPDFSPENFDIKTSKWFYSKEFNDFIKPASFFGEFYIDSINKVIYFDLVV